MNEITKANPETAASNPFAQLNDRSHVNSGTVEIEQSRAIAEAQGKLLVAKRFPRDRTRAYEAAIESCRRKGLADEAQYAFQRGSEMISGPSIRLAEELARCWGNIEFGIKELSRKDGVSEMESYCWDLESNTMSCQRFSVRHLRDTKAGPKTLTSERDIYELTANMAGRRLRARILAVLPPDLVSDALSECNRTLAGNSTEPMADRVRRAVRAFGKFGVSAALIEKRLGHSLDQVLPEELADLQKIANSLKDGVSKAGEWFALAEGSANDINEKLSLLKPTTDTNDIPQ